MHDRVTEPFWLIGCDLTKATLQCFDSDLYNLQPADTITGKTSSSTYTRLIFDVNL